MEGWVGYRWLVRYRDGLPVYWQSDSHPNIVEQDQCANHSLHQAASTTHEGVLGFIGRVSLQQEAQAQDEHDIVYSPAWAFVVSNNNTKNRNNKMSI